MLVTIDPVTTLKGQQISQANVETFVNYYQTKQGKSTPTLIERATGNVVGPGEAIGAPLSVRLSGNRLNSQAQAYHPFNVTTHPAFSNTPRYQVDPANPATQDERLRGSEVNHDTIVWHVASDVRNDLQ